MRVEGTRLFVDNAPVPYTASPNVGGKIGDPTFIILHYTGGTSFDNAHAWLCNPRAKASAHLLIERERIEQLVPFDHAAWHAGKSHWNTQAHSYDGLNQFSIGIEMVNPGPLQHRADHALYTRTGQAWDPARAVLAAPTIGGQERYWAAFDEETVESTMQVCQALCERFPSIEDVMGHDEIAPLRKLDPGPAFDMESFRSRLFGRR